MRDENQLHAAVVEIHAEKDAEVKYSTVQIGIQEIKMVKVVFIILLLREGFVTEIIQKLVGHR